MSCPEAAARRFSGPQSGIIVWNDPELILPITHAFLPVLAAPHQVNRVAALAVSGAEMLELSAWSLTLPEVG